MTTEEKLAAIEAKINGYPANGVWYATYSMQVGPSDVRWLIAEVRRLQSLITTGKAIIHDIADGSEYRRGREDERAAVVAKLRVEAANPTPGFDTRMVKLLATFTNYCASKIERGEHVAEQ